ncbi:hypothetical protein PF005_g20299 [Phytophthora fragariae]|uniref:Uncharacterized protein n=1 Tax=Phytophthora fragariae TaxID=53985 RepID=A0A6A3E8E7_9STRA|nr:hypothetical protein PF003_g30531 [Phytophthora fragariae]KAE8928607.1 hypothetical protein PF009_g21249 [Phytophthora fragariae]KAE8988606.1 hypothetical protein PF011_g19098 [Phytophthora fragariae]KAE9088305.1 hypothetical protein PF007_g20024 [Phytophthora fragariae]KAE9088682.1 hypothetical protein PF010_g19292 [Phytophthora fragariae]
MVADFDGQEIEVIYEDLLTTDSAKSEIDVSGAETTDAKLSGDCTVLEPPGEKCEG